MNYIKYNSKEKKRMKVLFYNLEIINEENKLKNGNNKPDENILINNNN
jgi:hypothetical protein